MKARSSHEINPFKRQLTTVVCSLCAHIIFSVSFQRSFVRLVAVTVGSFAICNRSFGRIASSVSHLFTKFRYCKHVFQLRMRYGVELSQPHMGTGNEIGCPFLIGQNQGAYISALAKIKLPRSSQASLRPTLPWTLPLIAKIMSFV